MITMITHKNFIPSQLKKKNLYNIFLLPLFTSQFINPESALTCLELCVIVCASNQLKCLLKPYCVLGRTVQRLDAANEGGHFPFCLTGGWRQECLVTLVE